MANPYINLYGKDTRFKPGRSGNPKGRPKGSRSHKKLVKEMLESTDVDWSLIPVKNVEELAKRYDAPVEAIICVAIAQAVEGNASARRWLTETAYGKSKNGLIGEEKERPRPIPILGGAGRPKPSS